MERQPPSPADGSTRTDFGNRRLWIVAWLVLLAWQGWLTWGLFGPSPPAPCSTTNLSSRGGTRCTSTTVILAPAPSWSEAAYVVSTPAFQAGYPKTPVFDSGSRPAELFLLLAGGRFCPAAYKLGLAAFAC